MARWCSEAGVAKDGSIREAVCKYTYFAELKAAASGRRDLEPPEKPVAGRSRPPRNGSGPKMFSYRWAGRREVGTGR